ncbi:MAG: GGDEF domain-containing protein [Bacillota bacterium]|nr:MAG: GGDEF domain-containing protein [Bacillota bacterium]
MTPMLWIIFYVFAIISFIPVVKLEEVRSKSNYRQLWYLSLGIFAWTIVIALKFVVESAFFVYYFQLLTYPILALVSYFIFETFQHYTKRKTPPLFKLTFILFILTDFIISMTNPFHEFVVKLPLSSDLTIESFETASYGFFFFIHAVIIYVILVVGFINLLKFVRKEGKENVTAFPFQLILFSIVFGIVINIINIFFYSFVLDPTYIFLVIVTYMLYTYIYRKDFNYNLFTSSKDFILDHMREMYLILDNKERVVEYSRNLKDRFKIEFSSNQTYAKFIDKLKEKAIIFTDIQKVKNERFIANKAYLHMTKQTFKVGTFKEKGYLISLFDETSDVKYLKEIEQLRTHDMMTNLYNRNYFEEHRDDFEKAYKQLGIIMIDLDGLKLFNDYLGHKAGDMLIQRFSRIINDVISHYTGVLAMRMGGDEFVIIIPHATQEVANEIVRRIEELATHKEIKSTHEFSYGISIRRNGSDTFTTMMRRADQRMYDNKNLKADYKVKLEQYFKSIEKNKS